MRWSWVLIALPLACAHAPAAEKPPAPPPIAAPAPAPVVPAEVLLRQARELISQRSWEAARERLDAFLAREPAHAAALFEAGWVAEQLSDGGAAATFYRRSLASEPGNAAAALDLVRLLPGDPAGAEEVLRAALREHPDDPRLLNALSAVLRARKRPDEAAAAARKVLERNPRDAGAWRNLAAVEADRGRLRLSETALNNARKLDPADAGIPNALGLLAVRRDEVNAARAWFEEAVRVDPSCAAAWANLGALALRYRDYAGAEQALAKALQLDPARPQTRLAHAWALEGLRKPAEARAEYERVLAADPRQDDAFYGRALALKAEGDLAGAAAAFRQYVGLQGAAHLKEAREQLAAVDLRLQAAAARSSAADPGARADMSKSAQPAESPPPAGEAVR